MCIPLLVRMWPDTAGEYCQVVTLSATGFASTIQCIAVCRLVGRVGSMQKLDSGLDWTMDWTLDWTLDWTMDWTMDWTLDWTLDSL